MQKFWRRLKARRNVERRRVEAKQNQAAVVIQTAFRRYAGAKRVGAQVVLPAAPLTAERRKQVRAGGCYIAKLTVFSCNKLTEDITSAVTGAQRGRTLAEAMALYGQASLAAFCFNCSG